MNVENQIPEDLDAFDALFNGVSEEPAVPVEDTTKEITPGNDTPATAEEDVEPQATESDEDENEEIPVDEPDDTLLKIGKKKQTARERIEELNAKFREEERRRIEIETRLQEEERLRREYEAKLRGNPQETPKEESDEPSPDAVGEDGEPLYPLGEFDPKFIKDLQKHVFDKLVKEHEAAEEAKRIQLQEQQMRTEIESAWADRLTEAEQRLPDLRTKAMELEPILAQAEPAYVDLLTATIMTLDNGPDVLNYLADNPAETQKIVNGGPRFAAVHLGRLDALVAPREATPQPNKVISEAPPPPAVRTRGTGGKFAVAPDTDDLSAFEEHFFRR